MDGGRVAAQGFRYQYWRTLEVLLDVVDESRVACVRVEGPDTETADGDAVDFDVMETDGRCRLAVQVKSKLPGGSISAASVFGVLARLIRHDAAAYELQTNAAPTPSSQALANALAAEREPAQLQIALAEILTNAPARLAQLRALAPRQLQRLAQCRVRFDARGEDEIRDSLRERLRGFRNQARAGLGQRSAGMLSGYLMSEILDRAANEAGAAFTIEQLRSYLLVDDEVLARAYGSRDWGVLVGSMPPIPDVDRRSLLQNLMDTLHAQPSDVVRRVALVGLSGIGKSSLAAAYVADRADSYDHLFWVDGESETATTAAFREVLAFLQPRSVTTAYIATASQVRDRVHTELSRLPGRWAMVFDNVVDQRTADRWIPRLGRGDVIITSIDSAARHAGPVMQVDVMTPSEAVELLRRRLRLHHDDDPVDREPLRRLARELSYWPLALELAAGYLDSCGISLNNLDDYLERLKVRSLMDEASVPAAYPRTLAAALFLCVEDLEGRVARLGPTDVRPYFALGVLTYSAYLASRHLPVHLLLAATVHDPPPEDGLGPRYLDQSDVAAGEVVRELRRFSLVAFDDDLPSMEIEQLPDADRTVAVNAIVQELIRARADRDPVVPAALNRLANHVERWLMPALELNYLQRTSIIFNHAEALASHLRRLNVTGERIPLFYGNLAAVYRARRDLVTAAELLRTELDLLHQMTDPNQVVAIQAKLSLITTMLDDPEPTVETDQEVAEHLADVLDFATAVGDEHPGATVKLAMFGRDLLRYESAHSRPELASLASRFDDLIALHGPTDFSRAVNAVRQADELVTADSPTDAERLCRDALQSGHLTGLSELNARRILVEALVHQGNWDEASEEHERLRRHFGSTGYYPSFVTRFVHDVGATCAAAALTCSDHQAARLLAEVVEWPIGQDTCLPHHYTRIQVLTAARDCTLGDYPHARDILDAVRPADIHNDNEYETKLWCGIWQLCRLALFRASWEELEHSQ
jgi:hypothetical protein